MRWRNRESSDNIEDRRGQSGGGGGLPPIGGKGGILLLVVVLVAGYYGIDLTPLLNGAVPTQTTSSAPAANYQPTAEEKELADFTGVALKTQTGSLHGIHTDRLRLWPKRDGPLLLPC